MGSCEIEVPVVRGSLSGRAAEPSVPARGLVLALHGGGSRARYFDSPVSPVGSLLLAAAQRGWRAVALDRPGYGAALERPLTAGAQVEVLAAAVDELRAAGRPVALVGHSLGGIVGVHLAARGGIEGLVALSVGGVPLSYTVEQRARLAAQDISGPTVRPAAGAARVDPRQWYGPAGTWDERLLDHRSDLVAPTPTVEFLDALRCPEEVPEMLASLQVPLQVAVAEHELTAAPAHRLMEVARATVSRSPRAEVLLVEGSGHNLSLGRKAAAYHRRVLDFFDRVLGAVPA